MRTDKSSSSTIGWVALGTGIAIMQRSAALPYSLSLFGIVAGGFMALGLIGIPGVLAKSDDMGVMPWYLYVALFRWLGTYILYPIWAILLGRNLLKQSQVHLH